MREVDGELRPLQRRRKHFPEVYLRRAWPYRVWGLGFGVLCLGFRIWGLGFGLVALKMKSQIRGEWEPHIDTLGLRQLGFLGFGLRVGPAKARSYMCRGHILRPHGGCFMGPSNPSHA